MKTHLNLATTNLEKSVAFYATLLDALPTKSLGGYALFVTEQPPLELALALQSAVPKNTGVHFGVFVESTEQVDRAIERLRTADLVIEVEREEPCCYANQTKVWATDPDGRRWEVYTVHKETGTHDDAACCSV